MAFYLISQDLYGADTWNSSLWEIRNRKSNGTNTMDRNGVVPTGAKTPAAMVLT